MPLPTRIKFHGGMPLESSLAINDFEDKHGIKLPLAYREIVLAHDSALLEHAGYIVYDPILKSSMTYGCDLLVSFSDNDIEFMNGGNIDGFPRDVIAFAMQSSNGFMTCFDYRQDKTTDNPPIVMFVFEYDEDNSLIPVAPDFETFLANLIEQP